MTGHRRRVFDVAAVGSAAVLLFAESSASSLLIRRVRAVLSRTRVDATPRPDLIQSREPTRLNIRVQAFVSFFLGFDEDFFAAAFFFAGVGFFSAFTVAASAASDFCADLLADF